MATDKTRITQKTTEAPEKDDRVKVFIEKGYLGDEPNLLVSVNGVNYLLPRGEESLVPPHVAHEIELSRKAQKRLDRKQAEIKKASQMPQFK